MLIWIEEEKSSREAEYSSAKKKMYRKYTKTVREQMKQDNVGTGEQTRQCLGWRGYQTMVWQLKKPDTVWGVK